MCFGLEINICKMDTDSYKLVWTNRKWQKTIYNGVAPKRLHRDLEVYH